MKTSTIGPRFASVVELIAYKAAYERFCEVIKTCPGLGGELDAANLRWLIENRRADQKTAQQAAKSLASLAKGIEEASGTKIPVADEVWLLQRLPNFRDAERDYFARLSKAAS